MSQTAQRELDLGPSDGTDLPFKLLLELTIEDPEVIRQLCLYSEGEPRNQFAQAALRIGVLALSQAKGQLDAATVQREMDRMVDGLQLRLGQHAVQVQNQMAATLKNYFDPESGRFDERVRRLVSEDGELERVLRRQISGDDSELTRTLVRHVGQQSPLLKMLDPDESTGVLARLRESLEQSLVKQRQHILEQFSLDNKEGALSRLVGELHENHGELNTALQKKIDDVVKEFSLDEENSALSRLVSNVANAQKTITAEFSLDNKQSALARLKEELLGVLKEHDEDNQKFREEVKVALASMTAKREAAKRSTQHGIAFEDAVCEFLSRQAQQAGDFAIATGNTTGLIKNCKVGDCVIELGPDSAAPSAKVAVEAKEKNGYTMANAREEMETARKNRGGQFGLFVFSQRAAPDDLEPFARYGNDVFVVWDPEQPTTDVFLKAGLLTARALCVREVQRREGREADFTAIDEAILEIEKRTERLAEIETWTNNIRRDADKIWERIDKSRNALNRQLAMLRERIEDVRSGAEA